MPAVCVSPLSGADDKTNLCVRIRAPEGSLPDAGLRAEAAASSLG